MGLLKKNKEKKEHVKKEHVKRERVKKERVKKETVNKKNSNKLDGVKEKANSKLSVFLQKMNKMNIMQKLILAFLVPVVMMTILGFSCYKLASSTILTKYTESAISTMSAVGNYCGLVCDSISSKAVEMVANDDLSSYYQKYYKKTGSTEGAEMLRNTKTIMSRSVSTNQYMYSYTIIPEGGTYLSSLTGTLPTDAMDQFNTTAQGQYFIENSTLKSAWMGYHTLIDENLSSSEDKYGLVFYQKLMKNNTTIVYDLNSTCIFY